MRCRVTMLLVGLALVLGAGCAGVRVVIPACQFSSQGNATYEQTWVKVEAVPCLAFTNGKTISMTKAGLETADGVMPYRVMVTIDQRGRFRTVRVE